jgi:hypothetical protein
MDRRRLDKMFAERKVGIVGLVAFLILVGVPVILTQASPSARASGTKSAAEPVMGESAILPDSGGTAAPSEPAMLLVAGTVLLAAGILSSQILRLRPAESEVGSR